MGVPVRSVLRGPRADFSVKRGRRGAGVKAREVARDIAVALVMWELLRQLKIGLEMCKNGPETRGLEDFAVRRLEIIESD